MPLAQWGWSLLCQPQGPSQVAACGGDPSVICFVPDSTLASPGHLCEPRAVSGCSLQLTNSDARCHLVTQHSRRKRSPAQWGRGACSEDVSPRLQFGHTAGTTLSSRVVTIHAFVHAVESCELTARLRDRQSATEFSRDSGVVFGRWWPPPMCERIGSSHVCGSTHTRQRDRRGEVR